MAQIVIGGDLCPIGVNAPLARRGDATGLFGDLLPVLRGAELTVVNLEAPLIGTPSPVRKSGPVLEADERCLESLVAAGIDVVGLANNHAMDHGARGLQSTIAACGGRGISTVGAGPDLAAARQVLIKEVEGTRVGLLAMAEHEFGIAGRTTWGVNPLDPMGFVRTLESLPEELDLLIVLLHGGNEHYPYPRPSLMDTCRFLVEQGADVVVCQHSHCVGCAETYRGSHIVYGQGNLLFDVESDHASWYEGCLLCLHVDGPHRSSMEVVPFVQSRPRPGAHRMGGRREERFRRDFEERSRAISDIEVVEEKWDAFCADVAPHYIRRFGAPHRLVRGLDRVTGLLQRLYAAWPIRTEHLNLVRCESHREVLINVLSRGPTRRGGGPRERP